MARTTRTPTTTTTITRTTDLRSVSSAPIDILLGSIDAVRAAAATLAFAPSRAGKGETRTIRTRDREGNVQTVTTVVNLQSTIRTVTGRLLGRAIGSNEHQTIVDDQMERLGTAVRDGDRIQLWLDDRIDAGYSIKLGSVVNHYSILGEFCGYSTAEANDNALTIAAQAA
jgi:hypothetical protein